MGKEPDKIWDKKFKGLVRVISWNNGINREMRRHGSPQLKPEDKLVKNIPYVNKEG